MLVGWLSKLVVMPVDNNEHQRIDDGIQSLDTMGFAL